MVPKELSHVAFWSSAHKIWVVIKEFAAHFLAQLVIVQLVFVDSLRALARKQYVNFAYNIAFSYG